MMTFDDIGQHEVDNDMLKILLAIKQKLRFDHTISVMAKNSTKKPKPRVLTSTD